MNILDLLTYCTGKRDSTICTSNKWSQYEDCLIRLHYPEGGAELVSRFIPYRSCASIHIHASRIGVKRTCKDDTKVSQGEQRYWTESEDAIITEFYWTKGADSCHEILQCRTINAIHKRAHIINKRRMKKAEQWLYKSPVFVVPVVR